MAIPDDLTRLDRVEYWHNAQEALRLWHNKVGAKRRSGKITAAEWRTYWDEEFYPRSATIALYLNEARKGMTTVDEIGESCWAYDKEAFKQSVRFEIDVERIEKSGQKLAIVDPLEDFDTYSELDPGDDLVRSGNTVIITGLPRNVESRVWYDKGVGHFDGNFQHEVDFSLNGQENGLCGVWMLANDLDEIGGLATNNKDALFIKTLIYAEYLRIQLYEYNNGTPQDDSNETLAESTRYYLRLKRDEEVGDWGLLECFVYDDSGRTNLLFTLGLTLTEKQDFRYIYAVNSQDSSHTYTISGDVSNLDLAVPWEYEKTISGVVDVTGIIVRSTAKEVATGAATAVGTVSRATTWCKVVATAAATVIGTVSRAIIYSKVLATAAATVVGIIRPLTVGKVPTGVVTVTGTIRPVSVKRLLSGAVAATGIVLQKTSKTLLTAAATVVGTLVKKAGKVPIGAATVVGSIRPLTVGKIPDGAVTVTGAIKRFTSKIVATGQVTVGGLAIQKVYKILATAVATVTGTVTRKTGKILTGVGTVVGLLRPFTVGKVPEGVVSVVGTISQFLYDINYVMNQTIRKIYAKVRIAYSDPFFSGGVETSANQVGRESYTDQTADEVTTQYAKWFSLHRNLLDGTYHPMPSGKEHSVGWWGTTLSDAVTREFSPNPVLTIEFTARTIEELLVVGDDRLAEYPEDFTIVLYSAGDVPEHTEDVDGNNLITWTKILSPVETDIVKMTLTIEKWSRAEAVSKIAQFFTSLQQIYYSENGDLVSVRVLEEREYEAATIPQGDVSSSEITIRLNNINDRFSPGNWESELYGMLKNNRAITAWLGVDMIPSGARRWYPLGTFFSRDWFAPEDEPWAEVKGLDMLDRLRITEFSTSTVYENITLYDLAVTVMTDAGLTSADWEIDAALDGAAYIIPFAWFDRMSHREALRRIAAGALGQCYCNRNGKIVLEIYSAPTHDPWTDFAFTRGNFFTVDHPLAWTQMVNYVQARAEPRVPAINQVICSDTEAFTIGAGATVSKTHFFDSIPAVDVLIPVLTEADADIVVDSWTAYAWGVAAGYKNNGGAPEEVRQIDISGKPLEIQGGKIAIAQDAASIAANGKQALGEPVSSEFWQSAIMAQTSADALLAVFKDPRRDVMMRARGNIGLALGDRVIAPDYKDLVTGQFGIMRQDIDFDGGLEVVVTAQKLPDSAAVYYKTLAGNVVVIGTVPQRVTDFKEPAGSAVVTGSVIRKISRAISGAVAATGTIQAIPSIWRKTYSAVASVVGTVGRVWPIDIGSPATDREGDLPENTTIILMANPALNPGTITTVELYLAACSTGTNWKVGSFHGSGTDYTCRNYETLSALSVGFNQKTGLSIAVEAGDFIGFFIPDGNSDRLDLDGDGSDYYYHKVGDQFEAGQQTYTKSDYPAIPSLWGEGQGSN